MYVSVPNNVGQEKEVPAAENDGVLVISNLIRTVTARVPQFALKWPPRQVSGTHVRCQVWLRPRRRLYRPPLLIPERGPERGTMRLL